MGGLLLRCGGYDPGEENPPNRPRGAQSDLRSDVLVQPEEVRGIVLALERAEPVVLGLAVGRLYSALPLLPEKIHNIVPALVQDREATALA